MSQEKAMRQIIRIQKIIKCHKLSFYNLKRIWDYWLVTSRMGLTFGIAVSPGEQSGEHAHLYYLTSNISRSGFFGIRHKKKCIDCVEFIEANKEMKKVKLIAKVLLADMAREMEIKICALAEKDLRSC